MIRSIFIRVLSLLTAFSVVLAIWIAIDLNWSRKVDVRRFDPVETARIDSEMWRDYYGGERLNLYFNLGELLRSQYGFSLWKRHLTAYRAARAAFVFKRGKSREDYEKALPDLILFFGSIRAASTEDFDVETAARTELEWWIIHRERARHAEGDLEIALANAAAAIYNQPAEDFADYAKFRAEAMKIRDTSAAAGGVSEEDWTQIDQLLARSWKSLHSAVRR